MNDLKCHTAFCHDCHHPYRHGHYRSVKRTCWTCGGTGRVHDHSGWWPIWTLDSVTYRCSTTSSCTNLSSCCCPSCCHGCYGTCGSCGGLGYTWEQEWTWDECHCPCHHHHAPWKTTPWNPQCREERNECFNQGLGVNKVKSCV